MSLESMDTVSSSSFRTPKISRVPPIFGLVLALCVAASACDAVPPAPVDAAVPLDGGGCATDRDCDDGVFCNGRERCAGADDAGLRRCASGGVPCAPEQTCDEAAARCVTVCAVEEDADGDGADAIACGGIDCDDADPQRTPGRPEICDTGDRDEDCDSSTVGVRDVDGDGATDVACCNAALCGADCDDASAAVHPGQAEACDGADQDCDGSIDEGVERIFFPDADTDGWGDRTAAPMRACVPTGGYVENTLDCNDVEPAAGPGQTELCDGFDNDCDGTTDEALATSSACAATYGSPPNTRYSCAAGACTIDSAVDCRTGFWDCNGERSDGCETDLTTDEESCGACGAACGVGGVCTARGCDGIVAIGAGAWNTCAVRATGLVACWGDNAYGQNGDGTTIDRPTPVLVRGLVGVDDIGVSAFAVTPTWSPFVCARSGAGVYCWGSSEHAVLGRPEAGIALLPERVAALPADPSGASPGAFRANLSVGAWHVLQAQYFAAVPLFFPMATTEVTGWGWELAGDLGASCADTDCAPHAVHRTLSSETIPAVAAGVQHTCFVVASASTRRVSCRGSNAGFALGTTTAGATAYDTPGVDYVELDAGRDFTCARRTGGAVRCWGANGYGQLGDGATADRAVAIDVVGIADAIDIDVGVTHACAVRSTGAVMCWGENESGRLGDGTTTSSSVPVAVVGVSDAVEVSAGHRHTCVIHATGRVSCWGGNTYGQLGNGMVGVSSATPVAVVDL